MNNWKEKENNFIDAIADHAPMDSNNARREYHRALKLLEPALRGELHTLLTNFIHKEEKCKNCGLFNNKHQKHCKHHINNIPPREKKDILQTAKDYMNTVDYANFLNDIDSRESEEETPCPHGRPDSNSCPHCMGINTVGESKGEEVKTMPIPVDFEEMLNLHLTDHATLLEMINTLAHHMGGYLEPIIREDERIAFELKGKRLNSRKVDK